MGPLPQALRQVKFLLVLTDCFSNWVEAGAFAKIWKRDVIDFLLEKYDLSIRSAKSNCV